MSRFNNHRRAALGLLLATAAAALTACGKVGSPVPPEDRDPKAPRFYPADPHRFDKPDPSELPPPPTDVLPTSPYPPADPYNQR
jgi:hypothetical protein